MHLTQAIAYLGNRIYKHLAYKLGHTGEPNEAERLLAQKLQLVGVSPQIQKLPPVAASVSSSPSKSDAPPPNGAPLQSSGPLPSSAPSLPGSAPSGTASSSASQSTFVPAQNLAPPLQGESSPPPPLSSSPSLPPQGSAPGPGQGKKAKAAARREAEQLAKEQASAKDAIPAPNQSFAPQLVASKAEVLLPEPVSVLVLPRKEALDLPINPADLLAPAPQAQLEQKMESLNLDDKLSMPAPIVQNKDMRHFEGPTNDDSLDGMRLRLVGSKGGLTWGDLMHSTYEDFLAHLNNDLKKENLEDQKMFIIARFKRQLGLLGNKARAVLAEREKLLSANNQATFNSCVDEGILSLATLMVNESLDLCEKARLLAKKDYVYGFSSTPGAGDTEVLLQACKDTLRLFLGFCQSVNEHRQVPSIYSAYSMVDVLPVKMQAKSECMLAEQRICQYLVENFHDEAMVSASAKFNVGLSMKLKLYRSDLAKGKRERLKEHLRELSLTDLEKDLPKRFAKFLQLPHKMESELLQYTPALSFKEQRTRKVYEDIHNAFVQAASMQSMDCAIEHRGCKFK